MMLWLDLLGQRYSKLPSELMEAGDTFDLQVALTAIEYQNWREKTRANGQTPVHHSQEYLQARIDSVRAMNGNTSG